MEDSILNSLLRYSKQITPTRETYPIPYNGWHADLRKPDPGIKLSTYYLLDSPLLPSNKQSKLVSCNSTSKISLQKRQNSKSIEIKHLNSGLDPNKKQLSPDEEIRIIVEREKKEREKFLVQQKVFESIEKKLIEKSALKSIGENRDEEVEDEVDKVDVVRNMKDEIEKLKKQLQISNQMIKDLQNED